MKILSTHKLSFPNVFSTHSKLLGLLHCVVEGGSENLPSILQLVTSCWWPEISRCGSIYTVETGKPYRSGLAPQLPRDDFQKQGTRGKNNKIRTNTHIVGFMCQALFEQ